MAAIISGVFFSTRLRPPPVLARPIHLYVLRQQLLSSARHGVRIEIEEVG